MRLLVIMMIAATVGATPPPLPGGTPATPPEPPPLPEGYTGPFRVRTVEKVVYREPSYATCTITLSNTVNHTTHTYTYSGVGDTRMWCPEVKAGRFRVYAKEKVTDRWNVQVDVPCSTNLVFVSAKIKEGL